MRPVFATIHLEHLAYNYRLLQQQAAPSNIMAVIKANAYGHGIIPIAKALYQAECRSFAVTDADEGTVLRTSLPTTMSRNINIVLLSGIFDDNDAFLSQKHGFTPVVSSQIQLERLKKAKFVGGVWIKVNTGMQRIGAENAENLIQFIQVNGMQFIGILSHLACADTPEHPLNEEQILLFRSIQQNTNAPAYSLFNSAGIIAFSTDLQTDVVRPGIALYGAEPIPSRPIGLKPVMQLSGSVLQVRTIQADESVSYGATWKATKATHIAVVGLGYADGLPRLLSNQGQVSHASGLLPIVGRVCMDYCMLAVDQDKVKTGDEVIFFGFSRHAPLANDVASLCHSISYELFTGVSSRVTRHYIKEPS